MSTKLDYSNYLFFWGHKDLTGYLSNFYTLKFSSDGNEYICSEQYFMKKKQELFDPTNLTLGQMIMQETDPKKIKQLGRLVKNFNENTWNKHKYQIMYQGVKAKFLSSKELTKKLVDTQNKILVEASPYDNIWGIGLSESDAKKIPESQWPGQNLLGKVLMQVRKELN